MPEFLTAFGVVAVILTVTALADGHHVLSFAPISAGAMSMETDVIEHMITE